MKNYLIILILIFSLLGCIGSKKQGQLYSLEQKDSIRARELYDSALIFNLQENPEKALPLYDSAIILQSNEGKFYTNRGITKHELGDTLGALSDLFKALEIDSLDATAYQNLGAVYGDMGDYKKSLQYAEKVLALENEDYIYFNIGYSKYMLNDYGEAISAFLKYLKGKYNYSQELVFYYLGNSYDKLNDDYNAQRCWDKANELAGYDLKAEMDKTKK